MNKKIYLFAGGGTFLFLFSLLLDKKAVAIITKLRNPYTDVFFLWITIFMSVLVLFILVTTLFLIQEKKKEWIFPMWLSFGLAVLISYAIKFIVQRPRPTDDLFYQVFSSLNYSFPSMHAMVVFSVIPLVMKELDAIKYWWFGIAILIAFSRLYFSYHYLSDVVFGAFVGIVIGTLVIYLEKKYKPFSFLQ